MHNVFSLLFNAALTLVDSVTTSIEAYCYDGVKFDKIHEF